MIRKSWIVFLFAVILSFESILIEYLTRLLGISPLAISAFSIAISGLLEIKKAPGATRKMTDEVLAALKQKLESGEGCA